MKSFVRDSDLVKETAKNITKKVKQLGDINIAEELIEYREKFETVLLDLKNNNCKMLPLIALEQKEVDKYIKHIIALKNKKWEKYRKYASGVHLENNKKLHLK